jgi:hypothetical protein
MPEAHKFDPAEAPLGKRRCPKCGMIMLLSQIEIKTDGYDHRTFECTNFTVKR